MSKRLLSLFSGCGGMDLGFEGDFETMASYINKKKCKDWILKKNKNKIHLKKTMFEIVFANDILVPALSAWIPFFTNRNSKKEYFSNESIVDLVEKHRKGQFIFPKNIDVVTGGFPCQDFSVAGNRKGFNSNKSHSGSIIESPQSANIENRGQLYMWLKEVVEITKPKVFYAENVKGLISMENVKSIIEHDFRSIDDQGYFVYPSKVLNAFEYGIPQNRERIIFIGLNKKYLKKAVINSIKDGTIKEKFNLYPEITHYNAKTDDLFAHQDSLAPNSTCRDAFEGLMEPNVELNDLAQKTFSKAKFCKGYQGNKEVDIDHLSPTIRAEHHGNIEYRRLNKKNGGKNFHELKIAEERRLTVRECARLQTFPDNYEFVRKSDKNSIYNLSGSGAYKVIGNAVPPLLAYSLAKRLESLWDKLFISSKAHQQKPASIKSL